MARRRDATTLRSTRVLGQYRKLDVVRSLVQSGLGVPHHRSGLKRAADPPATGGAKPPVNSLKPSLWGIETCSPQHPSLFPPSPVSHQLSSRPYILHAVSPHAPIVRLNPPSSSPCHQRDTSPGLLIPKRARWPTRPTARLLPASSLGSILPSLSGPCYTRELANYQQVTGGNWDVAYSRQTNEFCSVVPKPLSAPARQAVRL